MWPKKEKNSVPGYLGFDEIYWIVEGRVKEQEDSQLEIAGK